MLHARGEGETFGLSVAEFSMHNRPVITSSVHHDKNRARMHLDTLGARGIYYRDKSSVLQALLGFDRTVKRARDWQAYHEYRPEAVMATFAEIFGGTNSR